jgi:anti-anti-sigma regulatory factor
MTDKLQAVVEHAGDTSMVKLAGYIDEDNDLKGLVAQIPAGTAMIDLAGVERINSCGIRDWVNWLAEIERNGTKPVLVSCSPAIVAQINLVKNFTGGGAVKSFQIPYYCSECDEEKVMLVETSEMSSPTQAPPSCLCETCGHAMEIDEMPQSYFAFLATVPKPEEVARGSGANVAAVAKTRVKTRERRSEPPARKSYPSLSAYQTPADGVAKRSSDKLLAKRPSRPSAQNIAAGSKERISSSRISSSTIGPKVSTQQIGTTKISSTSIDPSVAPPKTHGMMIVALIVLLVGAIGALGYLVLTQ